MPIYEYRCQQGHKFEVMQRMSDDPVISCETCASPVQRVFHPVAVHFKGKGFYNTDYGTKKRSRELKESGGDGAAQPKGGGESKSGSGDSGSGSASSGPAKSEASSAKSPASSSD